MPSPVLDLTALTPVPQLSGYLSVRETVRRDTSTFTVNRARVTFQMRPLPWSGIRLQTDLASVGTAAGDTVRAFILTDAYAQIGLADAARGRAGAWRPALIIGQFRTPFSLEFLTPFSLLASANRSRVVDRLAPRRDIGMLARIAPGRAITVVGALVNGEGPNRTSNPDGKQMVIGRLTLHPVSSLAISGKWASQSNDRRWGGDVRLLAGNLLLDAESIARRGPVSGGASTSALDASGAYVLAAYRVRRWLRPMVKLETLRETLAPATTSRASWVTLGLDFLAARDRSALQIEVIGKREKPVASSGELIAQFKALF